MSNIDEQKVLSFWQKPQVQGLVIRMCGASGVIGVGTLHVCTWLTAHVRWMVCPPLDETTQYLIAGVPMVIEWGYGWFRDHPNNIAARLIRQINGDAVSESQKAAVAAAVAPSQKA